jgi:hypothetical protein
VRVCVALFTADLRVYDNPVLQAALRDAERVVPIFVRARTGFRGRGGCRDCASRCRGGCRDRAPDSVAGATVVPHGAAGAADTAPPCRSFSGGGIPVTGGASA